VAHPSNVIQPRLRPVEVPPLIEQTDAIAPAFEFLATFEPPVIAAPNLLWIGGGCSPGRGTAKRHR